jgi:hypothetical protein
MRIGFQKEKNKKGLIAYGILLASVLTASALVGVFVCKWDVSYREYANVECEWDDDRDRYDVFVEGVGHLTIETEKATLVYLPEDSARNMAVVQKAQTIFHTLEEYSLKKFYINIGWKEELG